MFNYLKGVTKKHLTLSCVILKFVNVAYCVTSVTQHAVTQHDICNLCYHRFSILDKLEHCYLSN